MKLNVNMNHLDAESEKEKNRDSGFGEIVKARKLSPEIDVNSWRYKEHF